MNIIIKGMEIEQGQEDCSLGKLIEKIEAQNGVILEIVADGRKITNYTAEEIERLKPIEQLTIIARELNTLSLETIIETEEFIPNFIAGIEGIIDKFTQGNYSEGFRRLGIAIESLQWLNTLLYTLEGRFKVLEEIGEINFTAFQDNWFKSIRELTSAFESQDLVLTSDILEYELTPSLNDYLTLIKELKSKIN